MGARRVAACVVLGFLVGCQADYNDDGQADPSSWWPWICADGGLAPEVGCPAPLPACPDGGTPGGDGGC